jgi:hypothetical protein
MRLIYGKVYFQSFWINLCLRFYTLNLGTDAGQLVYSLAMVILPMIPLLILIGQLGSSLLNYQAAEQDLVVYVPDYAGNIHLFHLLLRLRQEVLDALDIAKLVQQLQEERAAVALNKGRMKTNQPSNRKDL